MKGGPASDMLEATDGTGGNDSLKGGDSPASAIDTCSSDVGDVEVGCEV